MGYKISLRGLFEAEKTLASNVLDFSTTVECLTNNWNNLATSQSYGGQTADAIKTFISEVHIGVLLPILQLSVYEVAQKYALYFSDYISSVDCDADACFTEELFDDLKEKYKNNFNNFVDSYQNMRKSIDSVSDLINVENPGRMKIDDGFVGCNKIINETKQAVEETESRFLNDLKSTREFLESVNEYLKNYKDIDKDFVCGYVPYGFSELGGYANCMQKYSESIKAYNENAEKYNRANELINEICIEEYEESRKENAKANIIRNAFKYGLVAGFGIMTIVTAGGTLGLSMACGSTLLTETFCAYDIAENIDEYSLAMIGNIKDVAENDLCDIYFKGNKNAYNCARNISDTIFFSQSFVNMTEAGIKEGTSIAGRAGAYGKSLKNATIYGIGTTVGSDLTIESMEYIAGQELTPSQRAWAEGSIEMGFAAYALRNLKVQREIKAPEMPKNVNQPAEKPVKNVLEVENPNIKAKEAPRHRKLSESSAYQSGTPSSKSGKYSNLDEGLNFSNMASQHMGESGRQVPVQTLQDAIRYGEAMIDPRGSNATMYYTTMYKNGKMYNLEVLYDATTNTVYHFEYARKSMGNLPAIK